MSLASSTARLSSQTIALRVGRPASSTGIRVSPWQEMLKAAISSGLTPLLPMTLPTARQHARQ